MDTLHIAEAMDRLQALALGDQADVLPGLLASVCALAGARSAWWMRRETDGWWCILQHGEGPVPSGWEEARTQIGVSLGADWVVFAEAGQLDCARDAVRWLAVAEQIRVGRERLTEANGRYRTLREIGFEGICVHRDGVLIEVNQALADLYGYSRQEMLGMSMNRLIAPEILGRVQSLVKRNYDGSYETLALRRDGERIPLEARGKDCLFEGLPARVASFRDLRPRKESERALVEAQQAAERSSEAKTRFLGNVSHELRTPMSAVLGAAHLVLESELTAEQRDLMERLQGSARDLLGLVDDLLHITRIEEGRLELSPGPFSVPKLVEGALRSMRPPQSGVDVKVDIADDVGVMWVGDEPRVRQILVNLLDNAAKFTPSGSIRLRVRHRAGSGLQFEVIDTGIGISAEQLDRVFHRFEQADTSTTRSYGGSGLGLHICRDLADRMGGSVAVDSVPGEGSTFRLDLPLTVHGSAGELPGPPPAASRVQVPLKVLLAEDNVVNQLVARKLLESMGHEVTVVGNGQQAVDALATEAFDAVLMDVQMPVLDGLDATRRIRSDGFTGPVIALTAHAMEEDRTRCLEAGMDFYLSKPIHIDGLRELLQTVAGAQ